MKKTLLIAEEIEPLVSRQKYRGTIEASEVFPFHCGAVDSEFSVTHNGYLVGSYRHGCFDRMQMTPPLFNAKQGASVQLYSHRLPGDPIRAYSSISFPVEYSYQYPASESFFSAFKPGFAKKEFRRFKDATATAYESLEAFVSGPIERGYFRPMPQATEILDVFSPVEFINKVPYFKQPVRYNLSYLALAGGRFCTVISFPSLSNLLKNGLLLPEKDMESLAVSIVNYPRPTEAVEFRKEIGAQRDFLGGFKKKRDETSFMTRSISLGDVPLSKTDVVEVHNLLFIFGTDPGVLRNQVSDYLSDLQQSGMAYTTHYVRAKDSFCSIGPGNGRLVKGGSRLALDLVPRLMEIFHKC